MNRSEQVIAAGHDYIKRGWRVVPLHGATEDGACRCVSGASCAPKTKGKHPSLGIEWQKRAFRSGADVQAWFEDHPHDNIGIATGPDSGIFVLDVDGAVGIKSLTDLATERGSIPLTRLVRTGSGGLHYFFRYPAEHDVHGTSSFVAPGIDIRGLNNQVVAPPSISARGAYEVLADHPVAVAPAWLLEIVRDHAAAKAVGSDVLVRSAEKVDIEFVPTDILNRISTLVEADTGRYKHFHGIVAACYEAGYTQGQAVTLVAPWCAAVDKFVNRVESEVARSWGKVEAQAKKLKDWVEAAPSEPSVPSRVTSGNTALALVPDPQETEEEADTQLVIEATWKPVDLESILDGTYEPETPSLFTRSDGQSLLYAGRTHSFHGESESGKSLVAQAEVARLIKAGRGCLYIDFESDAPAVTGRLLSMGCKPGQVRSNFAYLRPDNDPRKFVHERAALTEVLDRDLDLIVIDGVTDALGIFGASSKDNDDIAAFMRAFPRMLAAKTGAAVVLIDHVTKDSDTRGRYAVGGQAKMNALDGSAFVVEVVEPLGRGLRGVVSMRVAKDRPGGVRPHSGVFRKSDRTQESARVVVDSTGVDDRIEVTVEPHSGSVATVGGGDVFRPTVLMGRVSDFLSGAVEPVSWNVIKEAVTGNRKALKTAVALLVAEGYVAVGTGPRGSQLHSLSHPYERDLDPLDESYIGWAEPVDKSVETDDRGQPGPTGATTGAKSGEVTGAKTVPPLRGTGPSRGSVESVTGATTGAKTGATASDAANLPETTLETTACNECGNDYLIEVIETGQGYCPTCIRDNR